MNWKASTISSKKSPANPSPGPRGSYDVRQQGEAVPDVGTHLVDAVQWIGFPEQTLDWKKDIKVLAAHRWATKLTPEQFKRSTGLDQYPAFFKNDIGPDGALNVFANGDVLYTVRGVHAKVTALWKFEAPPGAGDTHYAVLRGTRATLTIRQGADQGYKPMLYVENKSPASAQQFEQDLRAAVAKLCASRPGLEMKPAGSAWEIVVPEKYRVGHETHFSQVTEAYLRFLAEGKMPAWEVPNMLAKYYTSTEAYRLSHALPKEPVR